MGQAHNPTPKSTSRIVIPQLSQFVLRFSNSQQTQKSQKHCRNAIKSLFIHEYTLHNLLRNHIFDTAPPPARKPSRTA
jgi:hypothetical protein